jgi:hypothetical protein
MTETPDRFVRAFEAHEAFERADDGGFGLTTTRFGARVTATETDEWALRYTVTVRAPNSDWRTPRVPCARTSTSRPTR